MAALTREFTTVHGRNIRLTITDRNLDFVSLKIENLSFDNERKSKTKSIAVIFVITALYITFFNQYIAANIFLLGYLFLVLFQTINLVKSESITFLREFCLQTSTKFFVGFKTRLFLPINMIHDVVINEVICDLGIKYVLIIRTKGSLYKRKPIIPLLTSLDLGIDCLEIVYQNLRERMQS